MAIKNKTAISLMLSYVLLVVMAISLSVGVYSWLKFYATGTEPIEKCPEDVSLIIQDYTLLADKQIELSIKNKGLFNISGYYIKGTDNKTQESWFSLKDIMGVGISGAVEGTYLFSEPFPPNAESTNTFSYEGLEKLEKIEIEPFRIQEKTLTKKKNIILCDSAIITQEIIEYGCDSYHLYNCKDATNCTDAGGYWYGFNCYSTPEPTESFNPIFLESLVSWWKFEESDGSSVFDSKDTNIGNIYGDTRLLMHFDEGSGNPQDNSSYDNDGVNNGATWTGSCQSGSCLSFDGINDYINIGDKANLEGMSQLTISAWIYPKSATTGTIIAKNGPYALRISAAQKILGDVYTGTWGSVSGNTAMNLNSWNHVLLTYDGSNIRVYLNGSLDGSTPKTGVLATSGASVQIGYNTDPGFDQPFNGLIDEVAIYSKALSQPEITEHFNAGRAKFTERVPGKSGNALSFDGVDDYVNVLNSADFNFGSTNDFTLGAWFKTTNNANRQMIITKTNSSASRTLELGTRRFVNNEIYGDIYDGAESMITYVNPGLFDNNWHYVMFSRNESGTRLNLYIDGSLVNTTTVTARSPDSNGNLTIGRYGDNSIRYFNGSIDEVMVFNQALSQENITSIYQYYTS